MNLTRSLLLILALLLAPGFSFSAEAAEKTDTVRIGVYLPMTGPMAAQGQTEYAGISVAHTMKPAVLGTKVDLFLVDSAAGNLGTAGAATRLIKKHKVHALIGELSGNDPLGGISYAEAARKPTLIPSMQSPAIGDKRYAFYVGLTDVLHGEAAARYASSHLKTGKAALLMDIEKDYSINLANIFTRTFTGAGGGIATVAYCRTGDKDFTTQLSSIMAAKADVLYLPVSYAEVAHICRQSVDMGINIHMISSTDAHTPELITAGGEYVEGIILTSDFEREGASADVATAYVAAYKEETGARAGRFDVLGADAYFLLIDAIERARSTAGSKMRQALATTKGFRGISGVMDMDRGGNAVKGVVMLQIQGDEFRYLETLPPGKEAGQ
ncbi:MAG: ABC transporter substrate-binding protein [Deltaproteobacteria bacterium]|nr:ABC transporter substrate-binding protein [Deltaproteobacteria bacterium]